MINSNQAYEKLFYCASLHHLRSFKRNDLNVSITTNGSIDIPLNECHTIIIYTYFDFIFNSFYNYWWYRTTFFAELTIQQLTIKTIIALSWTGANALIHKTGFSNPSNRATIEQGQLEFTPHHFVNNPRIALNKFHHLC